jgi:hypothetical protein
MAENFSLNRKQMFFLFTGVFLAAFLGIFAGKYVLQLKKAKAYKPGEDFLLKEGQVFQNTGLPV